MTPDEDVTEEEELPLRDGAIDRDMPCVKCGYNLRGLRPTKRCPECGERIGRTLRFVMARVLCPACLRPNHASATACEHCGAAITGAAGVANYYRTVPTGGGTAQAGAARARDEEEESERSEGFEGAPSVVGVVICWVLGMSVLLPVTISVVMSWGWVRAVDMDVVSLVQQVVGTAVALALETLMAFVLMYLPTKAYVRRRREYLARRAELLARMGAPGPATDEARGDD